MCLFIVGKDTSLLFTASQESGYSLSPIVTCYASRPHSSPDLAQRLNLIDSHNMAVSRQRQAPCASATNALRASLLQRGAHIANVEVKESIPGQRGMYATSDIQPGSPIIRIPPSMLITSVSARRAPHVQTVLSAVEADQVHERLPDALSDAAGILLFLLAELAKGDASLWKGWFDSLPTRFTTPFCMDLEDVTDLLSGTTVLPLVHTLRGELDEMYKEWFLPYAVNRLPETYPADFCTFEIFMRAHAIIESRAFKIESVTMLAPFADMANHQPVESECRNAKARGWLAVDSPESVVDRNVSYLGLELHVGDRLVRQGEEICISYGALPNWQLLLHYGFAIPSNPADSVLISLSIPEEDQPQLFTLKMLFLNLRPMDLDVDHKLTIKDPLPNGLVASTRLLLLDSSETTSLSASTAYFGKPISTRNEGAVVTELRRLVKSMMNGFERIVEEDGQRGEGDSFLSSCNVYVSGQRAILTAALDAVEALSGNMSS